MSKLHFNYTMRIGYTQPASVCRFTIKCLPGDTLRQKISETSIRIFPENDYMQGTDSFGNRSIYGCVSELHTEFSFELSGLAEIGTCPYEEIARTGDIGIFRYPFGCNRPGEKLRAYSQQLPGAQTQHVSGACSPQYGKSVTDYMYSVSAERLSEAPASMEAGERQTYALCLELMHRLYADFRYQPGCTDMQTTAEEAWSLGCGVCQDYAHIYIALLQLRGIPARYVTGMIPGEGASHAWVEACCASKWYGFDPTNDTIVTDSHIRIGVGRDASDCLINRGLMRGGGQQTQEVHVIVEEM